LVERRTGRLAARAFAVDRALPRLLAVDFLAGLDDFLAMVVLLVLGASQGTAIRLPKDGGDRENLKS
jgi:hypothetical protein